MPNRIIKESICTSENIDQLTEFQETFFYRLMVNCDDFGRFDARPKLLSSRLFPLRDISTETVTETLEALQDADLIILYEVGGHPYLQMKTWDKHQQARATKSKYPSASDSDAQPGDNNCNQPISNDINCNQGQSDDSKSHRIRNRIRNTISDNRNRESREDDDDLHQVQHDHDKVMTAAEDAGFKMSNDVRASLIALYADYGVDKILEALKSCVEHGATNLAYLKAVLKGTGKKPDDRSYAGAENEAHDRLLRMSGIDPKTGKKVDAKDIHGYQQRDYSGAQAEAIKRMMEDTWGDEKGAS